MKISSLLLVCLFIITGCTSMQVIETNEKTGYFPTETTATVALSKPFDLDSRKNLILVPNGEFNLGMVENIKYFDKAIQFQDLEKKIIQDGLTDKVPSLVDRIGLHNAAISSKPPFLWLRYETKVIKNRPNYKLILTDPVTMDDYFIAETDFNYWNGTNDQTNWYPMYNALIDYIKQNSKTYKKSN